MQCNTALDQTGAGSGGTRNIGGTSHYHVALEHELAALHSKEQALLYSSAYVANEWTLVALKQIVTDIVYLSDSMNHASLIQGIRHSGAPKEIWQHNDMEGPRKKTQRLFRHHLVLCLSPCIAWMGILGRFVKFAT